MKLHWVLGVVSMVLLTACGSTEASRLPVETGNLAAPDSVEVNQEGTIRIQPLDQLEIKVFGVDQLDGLYQVDPEGRIRMPLLGIVEANGTTIFDLADYLEARLEERYLQNPLVTVSIVDSLGAQFVIEGAVGSPGLHSVRDGMTLLQAIAVSGGPTAEANPNAVLIFRTIEGERRVARYDLSQIRVGQSDDPTIYGNDLIMVDGQGDSPAYGAYEEVLRSLPLVGLFIAVF